MLFYPLLLRCSHDSIPHGLRIHILPQGGGVRLSSLHDWRWKPAEEREVMLNLQGYGEQKAEHGAGRRAGEEAYRREGEESDHVGGRRSAALVEELGSLLFTRQLDGCLPVRPPDSALDRGVAAEQTCSGCRGGGGEGRVSISPPDGDGGRKGS